MTRQPNSGAILAGAMGGAFFEGFVVSEALKLFVNLGKKPNLFFWRSHDGLEVDLLIQMQGKIYPIEIKMTATPTLRHLEPLNKFKNIIGNDAAEIGILVCQVPKKTILADNNMALPWFEFSAWLQEKLTTAEKPQK